MCYHRHATAVQILASPHFSWEGVAHVAARLSTAATMYRAAAGVQCNHASQVPQVTSSIPHASTDIWLRIVGCHVPSHAVTGSPDPSCKQCPPSRLACPATSQRCWCARPACAAWPGAAGEAACRQAGLQYKQQYRAATAAMSAR